MPGVKEATDIFMMWKQITCKNLNLLSLSRNGQTDDIK